MQDHSTTSAPLCKCGCGKPTKKIPKGNKQWGYVKGEYYPALQGHGQRRSLLDRFWEAVKKGEDCWQWIGAVHDFGYGVIGEGGRGGRTVYVHRLSYEIHHGPIPRGMYVLHKCDNPPCCNPDHLYLGHAKENMRDVVMRGRGNWGHSYGERNAWAKLTAGQVLEIRRRYSEGNISGEHLAQEYGVSDSRIFNIIHRKGWKHLP